MITRDMIAGLLNTATDIHKKSLLKQAVKRRLHASISGFFTWAESHAPENPARNIRIRKPAARCHIIQYADLHQFWQLLDNGFVDKYGKHILLDRRAQLMLKIDMLLPRRSSEISQARIDEFDFEAGTWIIDANRHKNGLPAHILLPPLVLVYLKEAATLAQSSQFLFPKHDATAANIEVDPIV